MFLFSKRYAIPEWLLAVLVLVPAAVWGGRLAATKGSGLLDRVLSQAAGSVGGQFAVALIGVAAVIYPVWIIIVLRGKPRNALGSFILLLALSRRFERIGGVNIYCSPTASPIVVSLTTFSLLFLWVVLRARGVSMSGPAHETLRGFEKLLLLFVTLGTVAQFVNHTPYNAFWLSISRLWYYVVLFSIVCSTF